MIKLLITIIILSLPLGEIIRIDLGNDVFLKPLDVIVAAAAVLFVIQSTINNKKFIFPKLAKGIIIFSFIGIFSLVLNYSKLSQKEFLASFLYWFRFVSYASLYFMVINIDKNFVKYISKLLLLSGIIILVLGFIQYFLYPNLQNLYYLGWDEHNYRMFSVFLDPNFAGAFFVIFLIYLLGLVYKANKSSEKQQIYFLSILAILDFIAIILTYSRSALLMLAAGLMSYFIILNKKIYILYFFIIMTLIIVFLSRSFDKENTNLFRTTSSFARINSYTRAIEVVKINPFFGVGFNAYRYVDVKSVITSTKVNYQEHAGAGVDNSLLFVMATTGIIGLLAYIYFYYSVLKRALYLKSKRSNIYSLIVICSLTGLLVNSFFINSLFYPSIMLWMWIQIGLMENN